METKQDKIKELERKLQDIEKKVKESDLDMAFFNELKSYHGEDEVIPSTKIADILEQMPPRIKTGNYDLDQLTGGFGEENLVVVSGPTGQGKTLFCQNLTAWLYKEKHETLWFSFEMSLQEIYERFQFLEHTPVFYTPKSNVHRSIVWVERKIVEAIAKYQTKFVIIDHTHYLFDMKNSDNVSLSLGDLIRQLKLIARKYGIVIILIHHLTKTDSLEGPTMGDLRDSSFVGQEADYVIMIWRKPFKTTRRQVLMEGIAYTNDMLVSVVKNRAYGKLGTITLEYDNYNLKPAYAQPTQ